MAAVMREGRKKAKYKRERQVAEWRARKVTRTVPWRCARTNRSTVWRPPARRHARHHARAATEEGGMGERYVMNTRRCYQPRRLYAAAPAVGNERLSIAANVNATTREEVAVRMPRGPTQESAEEKAGSSEPHAGK